MSRKKKITLCQHCKDTAKVLFREKFSINVNKKKNKRIRHYFVKLEEK